jgi:hypothetical protein
VVQWSEFLATDPEVRGSIPGATRFSEKHWVWNGVLSIIEEIFESILLLGSVGIHHDDHVALSFHKS